ncbi:MAG: hypothetical protein V4579_03705 [Pseudomonadota bacterium]
MNAASDAGVLPHGFADLEQFVPVWAHPTVGRRIAARCNASMDDIRTFYDAAEPRLEAMLAHLDAAKLDSMAPADARLMQLALALVQAAVAVEINGAPIRPGTPWPNSIRVVAGPQPFG